MISWQKIREEEQQLGIEHGIFPRGVVYSLNTPLTLGEELGYYQQVPVPRGQLWVDTSRVSVSQATAGDFQVVLIGIAVLIDDYRTGASHQEVTDAIAAAYAHGAGAVEELQQGITGRFTALVFHGDTVEVFVDPAGSRSLYYRDDQGILASHYHLLGLVAGQQEDSGLGENIYRWWDFTPEVHTHRLLGNHLLVVAENGCQLQSRFWPVRESFYGQDLTREEVYAEIVKLWREGLDKGIEQSGKQPLMSITGGRDSRLVYAITRSTKYQPECFTYMPSAEQLTNGRSQWSEAYRLDKLIVDQLVKFLGISHHYATKTENQDTPTELLSTNRVGKQHGYWIIPPLRRIIDSLPGEVLHLRGQYIEILRNKVHAVPANSELSNLYRVDRLVQSKARADFAQLAPAEVSTASQEQLQRFGYFTLPQWMQKNALYYLEVYTGGWAAEILNEQDLCFETFMPVSCRKIMELFQALPYEERSSDISYRDVLNEAEPVLNFFPLNSEQNLYQQWLEGNTPDAYADSIEPLTQAWLAENIAGEYHQYPGFRDYSFRRDGEELISGSTSDGGYVIPVHYLDAAVELRTETFTVAESGRLLMGMKQSYCKAIAKSQLRWDVLINGKSVKTFSTGLTPSHFVLSIDGLVAGDEVQLRFRSNTRAVESWAKASNTLCGNIYLVPDGTPAEQRPRLFARRTAPDYQVSLIGLK